MLVIMWYSILELLYSPFVLQLMHNSSGDSSVADFRSTPTTASPQQSKSGTIGNFTRPCPEFNATTSVRLLYYADPPNPALRGCYELRGTTPCGENMRFYSADDEQKIGECDCMDTSNRMLIYRKGTNQCYPIFKQGDCALGMMLDFNLTNDQFSPICAENPCYNATTPEKDIVVYNNTCMEVGAECAPGHIVGFEPDKRLPQCIPRRPSFNLIRAIGSPHVKCKPGTYRATNGKCQPDILQFMFD